MLFILNRQPVLAPQVCPPLLILHLHYQCQALAEAAKL
jgi:hypothetical protein